MNFLSKPKILAVDDEPLNLEILQGYLEAQGYFVVTAKDGIDATGKLFQHPDVEVIVLDRMMPRMDGMEFITNIKANKQLNNIPIIMQTAASSVKQIQEGIEAGVFYYLTKPYDESILLALVKSALEESRSRREFQDLASRAKKIAGLMNNARFYFKTLDQAKMLASFIAQAFPDPEKVIYGISEILINAVEHGNLAISYDEKKKMMISGKLMEEIDRRLADPLYRNRQAHISYDYTPTEVIITIEDEGEGFDWKKYIDFSADRATDPNGRGIATSKALSFDSIEYIGKGNKVICRCNIL